MASCISFEEVIQELSDIIDLSYSAADPVASEFIKDSVTLAIKPAITAASSVCELLECSICTNFMYSPIYQCPNGHTLCFPCKSRVNNRCPICRNELGNIRCLALEK
ncbi:hypothetical protein KI387_031283, partial [Taxus chinensis]